MRRFAGRRGPRSRETLFFELALEDLTKAADLFRPIHDATSGADGWVSLEVSPLLADEPAKTLEAASGCSPRRTGRICSSRFPELRKDFRRLRTPSSLAFPSM